MTVAPAAQLSRRPWPTKRLFVQLQRRPSTLVAGVLQPLIWLVLFGALFANAPDGLIPGGVSYGRFLGAGVSVFTAFSAALNAGLPVMFDREFGFSIACWWHLCARAIRSCWPRCSTSPACHWCRAWRSWRPPGAWVMAGPVAPGCLVVLLTLLLLVAAVTALSLGLGFRLAGAHRVDCCDLCGQPAAAVCQHGIGADQLHAVLVGLACSLKSLTFAIEPIRAAYLGQFSLNAVVLEAPYGSLTAAQCLSALLILSAALFVSIRPLLDRKLS